VRLTYRPCHVARRHRTTERATDADDAPQLQTTDDLFFGLVHGFEKEFGYFSVSELESAYGPYGVGIERDLYFGTHHTVREIL
jgi:hypothetical protein